MHYVCFAKHQLWLLCRICVILGTFTEPILESIDRKELDFNLSGFLNNL